MATLAGVAAYWAVVIAVASASESGSVDGTTGVAVGIGLFLLPIAFLLLARLSHHQQVVRATALAAGVALVIWTWVPFAIGELVSPFAAALGTGGAIALRVDPPQRVAHRLIAVAVVTVYLAIIVHVAFGLALLIAPFLPLGSLLAADYISERTAS
ncbi:MAG: hypothetical protein GY720_20710 [bacterium]|nr:hypothetical protein [bacterium]